ncbi:CorA family divalent cation transporter [Microbacterium sp. SD291]|uniref:CorA family divalent cation transporter n=1 Tax=Microbacterium sp. SD291 TaxID=2782007 RepID=UPI001A97BA88|nr:CorA family divalent cation transporter [Microbacterium sp. SD291]MBO0979887.1 hypothetical protein [Microbacterium sp. SD291]
MSRPWRRLINPVQVDLAAVQEEFGLHPLIVADLLEGRQQPKAESFERHLYVSIWDVNRHGPDPATTDADLALILTEDCLLLVQRGDPAELRDLDALLTGEGALPVDSPVTAAYRVLEAVVCDFVELGAEVEGDLDELEAEVFDRRIREDYRRIYRLRQRIGRIDRAVSGLADALRDARPEIEVATAGHPELRPYFAHLELDARGVAHLTGAEHASLDAVVSSHESNVATRQNQDMRTISAFAALLGIPTVIAGIYGMNFKNLPLVQWEFGWLAVGVAMVVIDVAVLLAFRARGWLGGDPQRRHDDAAAAE